MATLTNSQRLAEIRKKREEENKSSSSQSVSGNMTNSQKLAKRRMERSIGFDTLDFDLNNMNSTIQNVYSGWQTPETIKNTRTSVESIQNRLKDLGTYQSRYGVQSGLDLDGLSSGYQSVLENLDMLESVYGDFETAEAYDGYMKKQDFKEQFGGLSFDDVQKKKTEYATDSDEYNFLSEYGVNVGYSNLNDYDAELASILEDSAYKNKLTEARNVYALDHTFDKYAHYLDIEGADELSIYNPDEPDNLWEELKDMVSGPDMYAQINSEAARAVAKREASSKGLFTAGGGVTEYEEKGYDKLTEDERKVYNIIRNSEGEKAAQAFLDDMEVTLSKRTYDQNTAHLEQMIDDSAFAAAGLSALSIPANLAGSAIGAVDAVGNKLQGKEYNPYGYNKMLSNLSADTRQYVGENIAEATDGMNFLGQNVPAFLYQTAMSMGDSAGAAILGGGIGSALLGSSAALQQAKELKEAGATEGQVIVGGLAAGAFETLFEKYSLDSLLKNKGVDSVGRWAVESLKQAGVEGSEEIFTETANLITDTLLRGQNSDALKRYHDYLERGFSKMEAGLKVVGEDLSQIALAGIGGALSGGIMGGTVSAASGIHNKQTGKSLKKDNLTADVLETAGMSTEGMETYKLNEKLAKKGITADTISNARLGNLYNTMNGEVFQNAVSQVSNDKVQTAAHRLAEMGYKGSDIMELSKAALTEETARSNAQKQLIERSGLPLDSVNALRTSKELNEGYKPSENTLKARDQVYRLGKINEGEVISDKAAKVRAEEIRQERPNLNQNEALMEAYAEGMDDAKRETFFGNSEGVKDVDAYVASFNLVYEYGRDGFGAETALNNRGVLSPSQTAAVYKAGIMNKVAERQKNVDAITAKYASDNHITAGTFDDSIIDYNNKGKGVNWSSLNTTQRGAVALAKTLSKATGINITLTESKVGKNGKYEGAAGSYNPVTNTIELDINSGLMNVSDSKDMMVGAMVSTLSHETTHWMKDKAPQLYQQLTDIVMDTLSTAPGYTAGGKLSRENIIHREMDRIERAHPDVRVTEEYAVDELVARACEDMLSNSKTAQEYLEQLPEAERKSLYEKIKDAIDKLKQWIKDLLGQYSSKSTEAQILREYKDKLDALQDTWDKAFKAAVTANQALQKESRSEEEEVQYSDRTFAEDIKEWVQEGEPENEIFILGTTGDVLQGLGAIESDIYMHGDKIKTILEEHPEITLEEIKKIPSILENPVMVLESKNVGRKGKMNSRLVLFGSVKAKNGNPMLVVLDLRPTEKHLVIDDMQKVASAYAKTGNPKGFLENSSVMYADKKRTTSFLRTMGFQAPIELNESGYIGNIAYVGQNVKLKGKSFQDVIKYADDENVYYQDRDSEGGALSRGQIKYFKNSKVRDAEGRLIPLYHQTDSEFTVFDVRAQGAGASDNETPFGIFLKSSDKDIGLSGKKQMKLYANITNPLYAKNRSDLKEQLISLSPTYAELIKQHQGLDSLYKEKFERAKKELIEYMTTWRKQNPNASRTALYDDEKFNEIYNAEDELIEEWGDKADNLSLKAKEAIVKALKDNGYDGIILEKDEGSFGRITDAYIALEPNQVKDINNTNPTENDDIRYQDRFTDDFYELFAEGNTMEKESEVLGEDLLRLADVMEMTGKKAYTDKLTDKVARYLRTEYSSNYDQSTLAGEISKIYDYIANGEDLQWNDVMNVCYELAEKVLAEQKGKKVSNDYAKMILKDIRSTVIRLDKEQAEEAKNAYGSNYRFLLGNRIKIDPNGIALSRQWENWSEQYPDIFDATVTGGNQITALVDLYSDLKDVSETVQYFNDSNAKRQVALEIYNKFWTLQTESMQAKYETDIKKLKAEHREAMKELKLEKDYAERWFDAEAKAKYGEMVKEIRARKDAEIQDIKTRSKARMDNYKDRVTKKALVDGITKKAKSMNKRLKENSKNAPIPEVMKPAVTKLLAALDFSSRQLLGMYNTPYAYTPTKTDVSLSSAFAEVRKMALNIQKVGATENSVENLYVFFPDAFVEKIEKMVEETNDIMRTVEDNYYILNEMSVEQLESLNEVIDVIRKTCADINEMHATRNKEKVNAIAQDSMVHMYDLGERNTLFEGAKKFLGWSNTLPINAFRRFGHGGEVIFEAFQDAWDKYAFMVKGIIDYTEDLYKPKEGHKKKEVDVRAWSKEVLEFQVIDKVTLKHRTVHMPVTHAMSLYCLSKREQARKHILGGGIRVEDFTEKGKKVSQTEAFTLGEAELNAICSKLTQKQKEVADALQAFMNTECAAWGNETSMQLYGIRSFTEEHYFPIMSDKNALNTDGIREDSNSIHRLLNMSFTKPLNLEAKNTIIVRNIFDVFAEHSSDMAKYHCFGPAVLDAFRWFNYKEDVPPGDKDATQKKNMSVKEAMERAYGKAAQEYVLKFLKDINGSDARLGDADALMKKSISKFKRASVGANLRVGLLQPMSYLRAAAVINPKYLAAGMIKKPAIKEAKERSGIALWKSLGFYDVNISRGLKSMIKHDETWVDKATEKSMIVAEKMDSLTWGVLWNACKAEVEYKHRDLVKGSEEYYHAVSDRFREVVYKTQVVDSSMTRTQMMREKGIAAQVTTAFMSESMVSYNMVMDVFYEWTEASRLSGSYTKTLGKYGRKFTRAVGVYTVTAFATALAGGIMDAARDEDEEKEFLEKYWENVKSNFLSDLFLPSKLPIVKDIVSIFQGYSPSRMDEQGYLTAYYAYKQWDKVLDGKGNPYKAVYQTLQAASQMTGVPLGNLMREVVTLWNITVGSVYPSLKKKIK